MSINWQLQAIERGGDNKQLEYPEDISNKKTRGQKQQFH